MKRKLLTGVGQGERKEAGGMLDRMNRMKQDSESTPHPVNPVKVRAPLPLFPPVKIGSDSRPICLSSIALATADVNPYHDKKKSFIYGKIL